MKIEVIGTKGYKYGWTEIEESTGNVLLVAIAETDELVYADGELVDIRYEQELETFVFDIEGYWLSCGMKDLFLEDEKSIMKYVFDSQGETELPYGEQRSGINGENLLGITQMLKIMDEVGMLD